MKRILLSFSLLLGFILSAFAQQMQELPIDPNLLYGKLDNGMTYYIRHNERPKNMADFYIAHNVGAVLEEDDQNGLAHFLEHMAFNGSKHFPEKTMIDYLETIGVKFGANLNAYTSFDETVYNITNVPLFREGVLDTCLLILHDWSGSLTLAENMIDKERGVIREEMRTRGDASWRIQEKMLQQVLPDNIYSQRNIIGTEDIILNFEPEALRRFYHKWYRPDMQALIIVGDIDPQNVLAKLKELFKNDAAAVNPTPRPQFEVAENIEPLVGIATDKEATFTRVSISFKHKPLPAELKGTAAGLINDYINSVISAITGERLHEMMQQANPPFLAAGVYNSYFMNTRTEEALTGVSIIKDNEIETGMKAIVRELERIKQHGFNPGEYDRARTNIITSYENGYNERDKAETSAFTREYVAHFTQGGYIPGIETEYNIIASIAPQIPVEVINQHIQEMMGDHNIVISLDAPEKEGVALPSKEQLLQWFIEAKNEPIEALVETVSNEPLLSEIPAGGTIVSETKDSTFDTYNYVLSNGVKVIIKPTTYQDDEITMSSFSPGGTSLFPESEMTNIQLYGSVSELGGVGNFSTTDLSKVLAGKSVSAGTGVSLRYESLSGSSTVRDFETMLQLAYLQFTAPRMDEQVFQSFIGRMKSQLESMEANPSIALTDTLAQVAYENPARFERLRPADLANVNYETIMNWRKDRFADASDFTFIFVGNIDPEASKGLIAQYLGALPSINRKEAAKDVNVNYKQGYIKSHFEQKMENPKTTVVNVFNTKVAYTQKNRIAMNILKQVMDIVYTETIREKESGTYGVNVSGSIEEYPEGLATLLVVFDTKPGEGTRLNEIALRELKNMATTGPKLEDFNKVKEYLIKNFNESQEKNDYWMTIVSNYYRTGYNSRSEYMNILNGLTPADIGKLAKEIVSSNNHIEIIMDGI